MSALRAVVFDLDDTLYPERAYVLSGFHTVAAWAEEQLQIPHHQGFAELRQLFEDGVRGNTFNCWLESHGFAPADWDSQMVKVYREHLPRIVPYPETEEMLQRLWSRYRLGLVSDGHSQAQRNKLASLGIGFYFDQSVFSDELGVDARKPNPRPFALILERLAVAGRKAVYVADNPSEDFLGARRVGMWTVRVRYSEGLYSHLEPPSAEHAPDVEIDTLARLQEMLVSIGEYA